MIPSMLYCDSHLNRNSTTVLNVCISCETALKSLVILRPSFSFTLIAVISIQVKTYFRWINSNNREYENAVANIHTQCKRDKVKNNYEGNRFVCLLPQFCKCRNLLFAKNVKCFKLFLLTMRIFFFIFIHSVFGLVVDAVCVWYLADLPQIIFKLCNSNHVVAKLSKPPMLFWMKISQLLHNTWHFEVESLLPFAIDICTIFRIQTQIHTNNCLVYSCLSI